MSCSVMVSDISRLWGTSTSLALFVDLTWPGRVLGTWSVQPTSKQPILMFLKLKLDLINQVPKILHYCLDRYLVHRRFPILWSARGGRCTCKKKNYSLNNVFTSSLSSHSFGNHKTYFTPSTETHKSQSDVYYQQQKSLRSSIRKWTLNGVLLIRKGGEGMSEALRENLRPP